ncbi:hypothetical protein A3D77_06105 [Candidatus Gottesmanbacteria bacterium RIFCSPHIGHO2_02_FULL_39_11]|uniref:RNA helicase n=1 Tax=Candidatus Gottesmanbacteria bacterium RIFCSPHIGHO2_02_FULL_39_11 TaxID=1798382 RepID=A0A1F5ZWU5_9BACT|nr:MAG: hypothetical protein A3D77_06105 [Candidatus Gottesmanbacteria bacterium RIFCSPHIGHO2_02_FULL_39_11]
MFSHTRRFQSRRGGFQKSRFSRGRSPRRGMGMSFNPSLLVKKADDFIPPPPYIAVNSFESFDIHVSIKENIVTHGYLAPTPIQDQAIPLILSGKDLVGIANTGTGKTAAFLIPIVHKIHTHPGQRVLIIAPTRELALQIQDECKIFTRGTKVSSLLCIGGVSMYHQKRTLLRNPEIVIGTPGRIKDLNQQGCINFSNYQTVILDEVDRMLDMGFINDIRFIVGKLPSERQSLFFSATIPPSIRPVMDMFLKNPITISVKTAEIPLNVDQDVVKTNGRFKMDVLYEMLQNPEFSKVLIFGRTKWGVERLGNFLQGKGLKVATLHGNKKQTQRQKALMDFRKDYVNILLATDIASRGLDIPDVTHVINYELPESYEDYVHRIGRTGRADKKGKAISIID